MPLTLNGSHKIDVDTAWDNFCEGIDIMSATTEEDSSKDTTIAPKCSDIYISTKTKIAYLSTPINLSEVFWKIPVMPYHAQQ